MGLNDVICPETPPAPHTAQILNLEEEKNRRGIPTGLMFLDVERHPNLASMNGLIELGRLKRVNLPSLLP